ncbi:hypothetical protein B0T13DRAFT_513769 [Neurospora crassa]|nr:hypothetical protein B0T13DRAFT_513769 [Neurospora crassa]
MKLKIPRTCASRPEYKALQEESEQDERKPEATAQLRQHKERRQAKPARTKSIALQIKAYTIRYHQLIWGYRTATFTMSVINVILLRFRDPRYVVRTVSGGAAEPECD